MVSSSWMLGAAAALAPTALALPDWFSPSFQPNSFDAIARAKVVSSPTTTTTTKTFQYTPPTHTPYPTVAAAWYAGFHSGPLDFPPEDVSWEKYTTINYAFAETKPDPGNLTLSVEDDAALRKVVQYGHEVGTHILITVGGYAGSEYFSTAVGSAANRTKFITALTGLVKTYGLDGIDFDWEYPATQGIGCNTINANDTSNFLELLKELRASPKLEPNATLSAAAGIAPWVNATGQPLEDVSEFAKYLNYISIMAYDIWGPWSTSAGPNAPLNDTCTSLNNTNAVASGSAYSSVLSWTNSGFPLDQIVLGVAAYGHSYSVNSTQAFGFAGWEEADGLELTGGMYPAFNESEAAQPGGDLWDDRPEVDVCGNATGWGGLYDFWGLITHEFLDTNGTVLPGIGYLYDNCTDTPAVYNATSGVWVSYDNAASFAAKGTFIRQSGLRGFSMWEAGGDFNDILLDSIRGAVGLPILSFNCEDGEPVSTSRQYPSYSTTVPATTTGSSTGVVVTPTSTGRGGHIAY